MKERERLLQREGKSKLENEREIETDRERENSKEQNRIIKRVREIVLSILMFMLIEKPCNNCPPLIVIEITARNVQKGKKLRE